MISPNAKDIRRKWANYGSSPPEIRGPFLRLPRPRKTRFIASGILAHSAKKSGAIFTDFATKNAI